MSFNNYKCPKAFNASFVKDQSSCANNCKTELKKCGNWAPSVCYDFCEDHGVVTDPNLNSGLAKARNCAKKYAKYPGIQCEDKIRECCKGDLTCLNAVQTCCIPASCRVNPHICGSPNNCPKFTADGSGHQGSGGTKGYGSEDGCFINQAGECSKVCETCTNCEDCKHSTCFKTADSCEQSLPQKKSEKDSSGGNKSNDSQRAQEANTLASQASNFVKSTPGKISIAFFIVLLLVLIGFGVYELTRHSKAPTEASLPSVMNFYRH
jgi:hypothetical protein